MQHFRIPIHGFSAKWVAYLLVAVSTLLLPFHLRSDGIADEYLASIAFVCMAVALLLGLFIPRTDRRRFLPFLLCFVVFLIHGFFQKL
jgi:hypothetical protein